MKKEIQVIMLPTEKNITNISKGNKVNELIYSKKGFDPHIISTQHLYFVLDSKIKAGDWVLSGKELFKSKTNENEGLFKKVIATTDKSLMIPKQNRNLRQAIINLPQPPQEFIEEYCRKGGIDKVIVEYVEYKTKRYQAGFDIGDRVPTGIFDLKVNSQNEITIHSIKNSWTREEVENIFISAREFNSIDGIIDIDRIADLPKDLSPRYSTFKDYLNKN